MPIISTIVTWKGSSFNVKLDTVKPVEEFRLQLQTLTGVPCAGQKIMGFPGGVLKASSWDSISMKGDEMCLIMSGESEAAAAASAQAVVTEVVPAVVQPVKGDGDAPSSSDAELINVTVKTAKGTVMCLHNIPADSRFDRIKVILSQQPHCCGQPIAMKLIYKGNLACCTVQSY
jgi:hypothetical protein